MTLRAMPGRPLSGTARVGGDKSCSHRALILGAMAPGESRIDGLAAGRDVASTVAALRALGVAIDLDGARATVHGGPWASPAGPIDCGNSGTTARLLMGAIAGMAGVTATLDGDASLRARPMRRLADPLRAMGATVEGGETLPLTVGGAPLGPLDHRNLPASAQVKTALLLAGLGGRAPLRIVEPMPSRDHGEIMLHAFGVDVRVDDLPDGWSLTLGERRLLRPAHLTIGADPSSAAFPLVAALLVEGSTVRVEGMLINPLRHGLYATLEAMGASIELSGERLLSGELVADVTVRSGPLRACTVPADAVPSMIDEIPILAMACAMAQGTSRIEGLAELRHKESDRLGALVEGLRACGVEARSEDDALVIEGRGAVRGGRVDGRGDHRIAMAFLALGLASERGVEVDHERSIAVSFPDYVDVMRGLGADLR